MFKFINLTTYKKSSLMVFLVLLMLLVSSASYAVQSLRGDHALDAQSNKIVKHKVNTEEGGYDRNYKLQPPLIPHKTQKYRITLKGNGCLKCHSKKAHKKEKAPMVGKSHFIGRDGKKSETISKRRYFCTQCHAPQTKDEPLVENIYEGI